MNAFHCALRWNLHLKFYANDIIWTHSLAWCAFSPLSSANSRDLLCKPFSSVNGKRSAHLTCVIFIFRNVCPSPAGRLVFEDFRRLSPENDGTFISPRVATSSKPGQDFPKSPSLFFVLVRFTSAFSRWHIIPSYEGLFGYNAQHEALTFLTFFHFQDFFLIIWTSVCSRVSSAVTDVVKVFPLIPDPSSHIFLRFMSPSLIKDPPLSDSFFLVQTSIHQCLTPFFPALFRPPTHPFHWSLPSSPSWLPLSSPVLLPFHLRVLPPPYCLHSFCPTEQGQIQSLPHSHFSHSFCQFYLPAFYPIPYSHCFPSLLFCTCELQMAGEGVGSGGGGKKSRLLLKNAASFSCVCKIYLFPCLCLFYFFCCLSHAANEYPAFLFAENSSLSFLMSLLFR